MKSEKASRGSGKPGALGVLLCLAVLFPPVVPCPEACRCYGSSVQCLEPSTLRSFSVFGDMENLTELIIENQKDLVELTQLDMKNFKELKNLTISYTGLRHISVDAFKMNPRMTHINLSSNFLVTLSWRTFYNLPLQELILTGNQFHCSCEVRWIQLWQESEQADLGNQTLTCWVGQEEILLEAMSISDCEVPAVDVTHENLTLLEGENVTLTCTVAGKPPPTADWIIPDVEVYPSIERSEEPEMEIILQLFNVSSTFNKQNIVCMAENIVGPTLATLQLNVLFPATILSIQDAVPQHFWCIPFSVDGNPRPHIQWQFNGTAMRENDFIYTKILEESENTTSLHGCLLLNKPTHVNNGNYTLVVKNFLGSASHTVFGRFMDNPFSFNPEEPIVVSLSPASGVNSTNGNTVEAVEEHTFGVSVAVGLAVFACLFLSVMLVVLNKCGRHSKFGHNI